MEPKPGFGENFTLHFEWETGKQNIKPAFTQANACTAAKSFGHNCSCTCTLVPVELIYESWVF